MTMITCESTTELDTFIVQLDALIDVTSDQRLLSTSWVVDSLLDLYTATRRIAVRRLIADCLAAVSRRNAIEVTEFVACVELVHDATVIESAFDALALI